jgi:pyrimidine operon attenuation protein/uracil phosphoribosyltransferase
MKFKIPAHAQKVLTQSQIEQKISRMAYEIMEIYYKVPELVILGIEEGGFHLAGQLALKMQTIEDMKIELRSVSINKPAPYSTAPSIEPDAKGIAQKAILLVDDVGNTGSTLYHALQVIYPLQPKSLHVAVLIDRMHKRFPIKADVVGLDLATTLTEHIHVVFTEQGVAEGAYLF